MRALVGLILVASGVHAQMLTSEQVADANRSLRQEIIGVEVSDGVTITGANVLFAGSTFHKQRQFIVEQNKVEKMTGEQKSALHNRMKRQQDKQCQQPSIQKILSYDNVRSVRLSDRFITTKGYLVAQAATTCR